MSMFMISPFKSLICSGIKKTSYRNNFLDLEKYSLKQSFNFKKRVGESHVLLHNMLVELFKGKIKRHFEWGSGHYFLLKLRESVILYVGMLQKSVQVNRKILATPTVQYILYNVHVLFMNAPYISIAKMNDLKMIFLLKWDAWILIVHVEH